MQKSFNKNDSRSGQAILEYVLLVAFMFLIFGMVFSVVRRQLFYIWVCELYPRIASVAPCNDLEDCYDGIGRDGDTTYEICSDRVPVGG